MAVVETVAAADSIIITQVLYDPLATDSGGEAVELHNPTGQTVDISGWVVSTETSPADAVVPADTLLGNGKYYLVADSGWSTSRDNPEWPLADHEEPITLANTDAGVAISNGTQIIDAVGWGNLPNIGSGLYEGTPHGGVGNGEALARIKNGSSYIDSNDNSNDFAAATPNFRNSSYGESNYGSSEITVIAVVEGSFPVINSLSILTDDDSFSDGSQVNPIPKKNKTVDIEAIISHENGNDYVENVAVTLGGSSYETTATAINSTSSLYSAKINMSYYDEPGNYTVKVIANDSGGFSANSTTSFEYTELVAIEVDAETLQFAAMPGMESEVVGDADTATAANTTIMNIGNSLLDVQLHGTNLSRDSSVIDVGSIQYTFNGDYNNSLAGMLSHETQTKEIAVAAASTMPLSFKLSVPTATAPGNYTGTITVIAVKS